MTDELEVQENLSADENLDVEQDANLETPDTTEEATDEVDIIIDGEEESQEQPDKQTHITARLQKRRDKLAAENTEQNAELERLRQENANLKGGVPTTKIPDRYDFDTDQEYQQALNDHIDNRTIEQIKRVQGQNNQNQAIEGRNKAIEGVMSDHYDRASKLKVKNYDKCEDAVIDLLGEDATRGAVMAAGAESANLIAYWGKDPNRLKQFIARSESEPMFDAKVEIGRLCSKLQVRPKSSAAPDPESVVQGSSVPKTNAAYWEKRLKAVEKDGDPVRAYRELNREAKDKGVNLRDYD